MVPFYYVRTQEKVEIALLDMFNNLKVNKYTDDSRTTFTKTLHVPLINNSDKNFANWWANNQTATRPVPIPIAALRYARKEPNNANRTQSVYARSIFSRASEEWIRDIQPTPYYLYYELDVLCDNLSDLHQLTENIMPYFNTFRTLRIKEFDFAPDIERKIPVYLMSVDDTFEDEIELGPKKRTFRTKFNFRLDVDFYRPLEIPEVILYCELNIKIDDIIDSHQIFVYPDPIAQQIKKPWEQIAPTTRIGYSLLKTTSRTLVEQVDLNGKIYYKNITPPDAIRPPGVPDYRLLALNFDEYTPTQIDQSGFGRDFTALNFNDVQFNPNLPPGAGQSSLEGWAPDPKDNWNQILNWFGTNDGLNESPFTFNIVLQFKESPIPDTIFQFLANQDTTTESGTAIPAGSVYYDWGITDDKLYYTFKTFGNNALYYTFRIKDKLTLNNVDIYRFVFVLYENGFSGMFGYSTNGGPLIALQVERIDYACSF